MSLWHELHREHLLAYNRAYNKTRPKRHRPKEKAAAAQRKWRASHPETARAIAARWRKKNPDKIKANNAKGTLRKRARRLGIPL
jgi:hypothetical protein